MKNRERIVLPSSRSKDHSHGGIGRCSWIRVFVLAVPLAAGCPVTMPPSEGITEQTRIAIELVVEGLTSPVALVPAGDATGRLFIVDQVGLIRILDENGALIPEPFLDLSDRIVELASDFDERGLLGLAFHPNYAVNGRFFVFYTAPKDADDPEDFNAENRVAEYRVSESDPNRADPESERVLLDINKPEFNHNGGQLAFGPDGFLYIGVGDGGGGHDVGIGHTPGLGNGQDKTKHLGKLLRIDVDSGDPYAVPPDNPFVDEPDARPEIWALGLRNPWRFSFDLGGQRRLFAGDAGQDLFEEVDVIERGGNYGWNVREGSHCFDPIQPATAPDDCPAHDRDGDELLNPAIEYPHADANGSLIGTAVIGGFVYRGDTVPELAGRYLFGDFSTGFETGDGALFAAEEDSSGAWTIEELSLAGRTGGRLGRFILGFGQDTKGEIYVLTTQHVGPSGGTGEVYKIVPLAPELDGGVIEVAMQGIAFVSKEVTIKVGQRVRWTNLETLPIVHTTTSSPW